MADLIDRGELLKTLYEDCKCMNGHFLAAVRLAPTINRWIPVEDALPDALQNVLICTDINTVTIAWINGDGWTFADTGGGHTENWSFDVVKYWMYLPEPPKCEQK